MDKIRVIIVEDSPTIREFLCDAIGSDPRLTVVAACESAEQALALLPRAAPDVISMDIHLPRMSGLEATRRIMETRPTPIVIVSQSVSAGDVDSAMNALRAGAVSAIEKPSCRMNSQRAELTARICRELIVMSQVKVVRQRFNGRGKNKTASEAVSPHTAAVAPYPATGRTSMVGIVASTGGPRALETILATIGTGLNVPIVLVQHMTTSFHTGFVAWLDRISPQPVSEACNGEKPFAGHVYVAPAEKHLLVRNDRFLLDRGQPVSGQRPSGTLLLQSMAEDLGDHAAGVVLTGMGDDGAEGLLAIRQAGGYTIAEDESTAVVNGMPEMARGLGAACASLPLESIGVAIKRLAPASPRGMRMTQQPRLLIVEDSPTQALRLQLELEAQSWSVVAVGTAEQALSQLDVSRPDVMIVDYCLPGISGDELCRRVRMNLNTREIPIIMLTADENEETEVRGLDSGADDFFKKSADTDILVMRIRGMLERPKRDWSGVMPNDSAFRRARVLAVDDSATYLLHLKCLLEAEGYTVDAVSDPTHVLTHLKTSSYDLALIDLVMPEMDGIELCRQIVSMRLHLDNPIAVLMLTGREAKEDLTRALEAGADDFVGKSSDQAVLRGRIRALLRRKFFQEENQRILEELKNKQLEAISARAETEAALARAADERRQQAETVAVQLQQAKSDLERSNEELLRSNDELRQFAFIASHDLQEPLRSITSFCNLLKEDYEGRLDAQADTFIARIVNGAKRMKALITDLLAYSRVDCDQPTMFQDVDLADVLEDVLANLQTTVAETGADVTFDRLPVVRGNRIQLVQLLQNLIGNAIMYRSDQAPQVEISASKRDDYWEVCVQDNGIGIAPEHHQQIFDIFQRLHSRDKYPGTGIGLASCKDDCNDSADRSP